MPNGAEIREELYQGRGSIANQTRDIICWALTSGYRIAVKGIGIFWVSDDGCTILCEETETRANPGNVFEIVHGLLLVLSLALQGTWCLHASGITVGNQAIAFLGQSGQGKSTLTQWLVHNGGMLTQRLADDILAVKFRKDGVTSYPHLYQPSLLAGDQPALRLAERIPLTAIYLLASSPEGEEVAVQPLSKNEAALGLVRHTFVTSLFNDELLAAHLDFCIQTSKAIKVRELIYPQKFDALPQVLDTLAADLSSGEAAAGYKTIK